MELRKLNFGKEPDLATTVASRIYWHILKSTQERRLLAKREEMVEYCALRIALDLGEPILGKEEKKKFLASVNAIMDRIHRKQRLRIALRQDNPDFLVPDQFADLPASNKEIPQQLHLPFPF